MASHLQIAANRKNSEHSTGPNTTEGKAVSSQNALKTGLDAKSEVIRCESRADLDELTAEYYARFIPTVPEERFLVDRLISSEWLHRRYLSVETAIWERRFTDTESRSLGGVFLRSADTFSRVQRRLDSAQRNHTNALKLLLSIQAKRATNPALAPAPVLLPIAVPEPPPSSNLPAVELSPPLPSRDSNGEVAKHSESFETPASDVATDPLNPKLAPFCNSGQTAPPQPITPCIPSNGPASPPDNITQLPIRPDRA